MGLVTVSVSMMNCKPRHRSGSRLAALIEPRLLGILASLATVQRGKFTEETYLVLESVVELLQIFPPPTLTRWKNKLLSILRYTVTLLHCYTVTALRFNQSPCHELLTVSKVTITIAKVTVVVVTVKPRPGTD